MCGSAACESGPFAFMLCVCFFAAAGRYYGFPTVPIVPCRFPVAPKFECPPLRKNNLETPIDPPSHYRGVTFLHALFVLPVWFLTLRALGPPTKRTLSQQAPGNKCFIVTPLKNRRFRWVGHSFYPYTIAFSLLKIRAPLYTCSRSSDPARNPVRNSSAFASAHAFA